MSKEEKKKLCEFIDNTMEMFATLENQVDLLLDRVEQLEKNQKQPATLTTTMTWTQTIA